MTPKATYRSGNKVYHTKENCPHMGRSEQRFRDIEPENYPEYSLCEWCQKGNAAYDNKKGEFETKECNLCGEEYKRVPDHIPECPER